MLLPSRHSFRTTLDLRSLDIVDHKCRLSVLGRIPLAMYKLATGKGT